MRALISSSNKDILVGEVRNVQARMTKKGKIKRNDEFEPKYEFNLSNESPGSRKDKHQRSEKDKCSYCKKGNHTDKYYMKNTIDHMTKILE